MLFKCTTSSLTKDFGSIRAVNDLNISLQSASITGLLGGNGAGKRPRFLCFWFTAAE